MNYIEPDHLIALIDRNRAGEPLLVRTTLTVELAQTLLDRYTAPRRALQQASVDRIAYSISHPDPEGGLYEDISVAPDGKTIAGQHLLHAVLQTGMPVKDVLVNLNRHSDLLTGDLVIIPPLCMACSTDVGLPFICHCTRAKGHPDEHYDAGFDRAWNETGEVHARPEQWLYRKTT